MLKNNIQNCIAIFVLLFTMTVHAQGDLIAKADESFERYAFIDARDIYLEVAKKGYSSMDLFQKLGDSYYLNADFKNALPWYERLINRYKKEVDSEYLYRYSQCLKSIEEYGKSDKVMEKFDALHGAFDKRAAFFRSTRYYLDLIEEQSGKFELETLDALNSEFSEYSPSYGADGQLVFSSSRGGGTLYDWNKMPYLDLYQVDLKTEKKTAVPKLVRGAVNTEVHESSAVFSPDGKTMYFTRNNYFNKQLGTDGTGTTLLKLYSAKLVDNKWEQIEELPFNSDDYSVAHPAIDAEGKTLYFASDMPGSYGESDLYKVAIYEDGTFGMPINLGDHINTEGRETFPYMAATGDLYFSSDGHVGLGGLDVFIAKQGNTIFSAPYNIGRPINSPDDDFSFIIDTETYTGYFSSNRKESKGSDDIFAFQQTEPLDIKCGQYVEGIVLDNETKAPLPGAEVVVLDENLQEISRVVASDQGYYKLYVDCDRSVMLRGQQPTYIPRQMALKTSNVADEITFLDIPLTKGDSFTRRIKEGDDLAAILQMRNIYFDLDKHKIRSDAEVELQKIVVLLQKYPKLKIDIRSHTDSRANDRYNMELSTKRAQATRRYILKKGNIAAYRVSCKGYGETILINRCRNNVACEEEEHEKNRRSEFIITTNEQLDTNAKATVSNDSHTTERSNMKLEKVVNFTKN